MITRALIALFTLLFSLPILAFNEESFASALGLELISEGQPYNFLGVNTVYANDNLSRQVLVVNDVKAKLQEMRIIKAKGYLIVEIPKDAETYTSMALVGITEEEIKNNVRTTSVWRTIWRELNPLQSAYGEEPCVVRGAPETPGIAELSAMYGSHFLKGAAKCIMNTLQGFWDSTGGRVQGFMDGLSKLIDDPKSFWDEKVEGMKNVVNFISHFDTKMKEVATAFINMPADVKVQMICSFIGSIGGDAALALLAGGAGLGNLIFRMEQYVARLVRLEKVFAVLNRVGKLGNVPPAFFERLSSNKIPQSMIDTLGTFAHKDLPDLIQGAMACVL